MISIFEGVYNFKNQGKYDWVRDAAIGFGGALTLGLGTYGIYRNKQWNDYIDKQMKQFDSENASNPNTAQVAGYRNAVLNSLHSMKHANFMTSPAGMTGEDFNKYINNNPEIFIGHAKNEEALKPMVGEMMAQHAPKFNVVQTQQSLPPGETPPKNEVPPHLRPDAPGPQPQPTEQFPVPASAGMA